MQRHTLIPISITLTLLLSGAACELQRADMPPPGLSPLVGTEVTLQGTYVGPGKFGAVFITEDGDDLQLYDGCPSPFPFPDGTPMSVAGVLMHQPDLNPCEGTPETDECPYTGIPAHYYIRTAQIHVLDHPSCDSTPATLDN